MLILKFDASKMSQTSWDRGDKGLGTFWNAPRKTTCFEHHTNKQVHWWQVTVSWSDMKEAFSKSSATFCFDLRFTQHPNLKLELYTWISVYLHHCDWRFSQLWPETYFQQKNNILNWMSGWWSASGLVLGLLLSCIVTKAFLELCTPIRLVA